MVMSRFISFFSYFFIFLLLSIQAEAKQEIAFSLSSSRQKLANDSYAESFQYKVEIRMALFPVTWVELAYKNIHQKTQLAQIKSLITDSQLFSLEISQILVPPTWRAQPYVSMGLGQLNRNMVVTFLDDSQASESLDSLSVVAGVGLRIFVSQATSLNIAAETFLDDFDFSTYQDNAALTVGINIGF